MEKREKWWGGSGVVDGSHSYLNGAQIEERVVDHPLRVTTRIRLR